MKSIRTMALVTGLLALSGVSQAQFSSTWTAVSDYDFRGISQSAKGPAIQASADYAVPDTGFSAGVWASNVDFGPGNDETMETDLYFAYNMKINDVMTFIVGATYYTYPLGSDTDNYTEMYIGANLGNFNIKQWYSADFYAGNEGAQYTEANYTQPLGDKFSLAFHVGYAWGDYWEKVNGEKLTDYAVQANYTAGNFTIFAKFTGTNADSTKVTTDANNNEPRGLIGVTTTFPWK